MSRREFDEILNCFYDDWSSMICRLENPERSISGLPSRRSFLQGAGSLLAVAADWARTENTRPWTPLFKIDRISKHAYAAIAQTTPVVNGNSAIIVTKQGLVIVDSLSSPSAAHALYNQFKREVADLPVRYVINTHHHLVYSDRLNPRAV
jgi:Metallo-beta-lactamase superfamily